MHKQDPVQSDTDRWNAVQSRDRNGEESFYYGVLTTGVYCRPGCSSRLPRRENVVFFDSTSEAEQAGYRPCKKCHANTISPTELLRLNMVQACRRLEQSGQPVLLKDLAEKAGMSPCHFQRRFRQIVGVTPKQYEMRVRAGRFQDSLKEKRSVTEALYSAGYGSGSTVYDKNRDYLAMQPKVYRNGARGEQITFATVTCFLGWMLVAATERGICAIEFGDEAEMLIDQLKQRFPQAVLIHGEKNFQGVVHEVINHVENPDQQFSMPLDIRGTAFQQKVWRLLRRIKPGETRSYSDIAEQIGTPGAVRAVARACGSNRLAVVIPCHRVVRKDGTISGYRWGVERKNVLLEKEKSRK